MPPRIIDCSDDSSDNNGVVIVAETPEGSIGIQQLTGSSQGTESKEKNTRSWVYDHSEKKEESGKSYFFCQVEWKKGRQCTYKVQTKKGNTTNCRKQ